MKIVSKFIPIKIHVRYFTFNITFNLVSLHANKTLISTIMKPSFVDLGGLAGFFLSTYDC